jgi:plastocyanin
MHRLLTTLLIASCALPIAACGGDDDGGGKAVTFAKGQPVKVTATEFKFDPSNITVEGGGGKVTFELKNDGGQAHNLRVVEGGSNEVGGTPTFQGGETKSGTVDLKPGDYEILCTVGDHADLGMKGKLTVK